MNTTDSLFVPDLQPAQKHPSVFKKFDALEVGQSFLLVNDHDPIPLYYEMKAERGEVFDWKKIENGPDVWKVEITRTAGSKKANGLVQEVQATAENIFVLNVTLLEPRLKHPTIFTHFDALQPGEVFQILNDHDPKPLYYQMLAERGNIFTWNYVEKGPQWWRVLIKKNETNGETVGQIAAKDIRKAKVFKKYGIDFCCGGKKTLKQVCEEKGIELAEVEEALEQPAQAPGAANDYNRWSLDFLADYIFNQHHQYYYQEGPVINDLLEKVAGRHGNSHPELFTVRALYARLAEELDSHFQKEERVVFPFIKALVQAKTTGNFDALNRQPSLEQPIHIMESDHEVAGEILEEIRKATRNYNVPEGACNSYQFLFKKLEALDEDLHQHIHLENNILFPRALQLEKSLRK